jgi:adenylate cyclase
MRSRFPVIILLPIVIPLLLGGLSVGGILHGADYPLYDLFLGIKPSVPESDSILLLNVDDLAIARVGVWPWSRSIMADALLRLSEFDARAVVFDIEYTEESPLGVDSRVLRSEIPAVLEGEFRRITGNMADLLGAISRGDIPPKDAAAFSEDLAELNRQSFDEIYGTVTEIARNNDEYLADAAAVFGNAFFTVNMRPEAEAEVSQSSVRYAVENVSLEPVTINSPVAYQSGGIRPAMLPILSAGRGAGFPNVVIDSDGVRRRISLLAGHNESYFGQLAFAPLWHFLGKPEVVVESGRLTLADSIDPATLRSRERGDHPARMDLSIPLTSDDHLLLHWPKGAFEETYRHLSFYYLVLHDRQEENLIYNLRGMEDAGYLSLYEGGGGLLDAYNYSSSLMDDMLVAGTADSLPDYREARAYFFEELDGYLSGPAEDQLLSQIDAALANPNVDLEQREEFQEIRRNVSVFFDSSRELLAVLQETREKLGSELPGSFAFVGYTGTGTTDFGVTPFDEEYDNVGTHATVMNTILQQRFLDDASPWISAVAALVLTLGLYVVIRKLDPGPTIAVGFAVLILIFAGALAVFITQRVYVSPVAPLLSVTIIFIVLTISKFITTAREKNFIRGAFGRYLSADVINHLIDDPDRLNLGGEKKYLTASFTDVKGFSSISEQLDPADLVRLLNEYLTEMSDIVLDLGGTIDKYEGDAIISFFGAPVYYDDHPRRACLAAVRMKRTEADINKRFVGEGLSPAPLLTRIGINTGDMVVGNMGTAQKMDYTIMGNAVNLAARLEGVNKQYGTWLLTSEATSNHLNGEFLTRKLDRVRVVGINEPVRLVELVEESSQASPTTREAVEAFHDGLAHYERRDFRVSFKRFKDVVRMIPKDGPATIYLKRCVAYAKRPPADDWDAVVNLTKK